MKSNLRNNIRNNGDFYETETLNRLTFNDYMKRLKRICISRIKWKNLPQSMNEIFLENTLYHYGKAVILFDENLNFINTKAITSNHYNIYNLPTDIECESYNYHTHRKLYTGNTGNKKSEECILVQNDYDMNATIDTMELFCWRLTNCDRICDINLFAQKTPIILIADEKQRFTIEQILLKYQGNTPVIIGDKNQLLKDTIQTIKTDAPFVIDKIMEYKKQIWNEALTFLRY